MPDYQYDVFISYARKRPVFEWVNNHFYPRLKDRLGCEMQKDPAIFIDTSQETGVRWPLNIKTALKSSRILVSVWSPHYFRSEWCVAEWQTILKREEMVGMGTPDNPRGLVYPVIFSDGSHFPQKAKDTQHKDLSKWAFESKQFEETHEYLEFIKEIQGISKELAEQIGQAPAWQNDWPIIENPIVLPEATLGLPRI